MTAPLWARPWEFLHMGMPGHPHNYAWNRYIGAVLFKFYSIEFHSIGDGRLSAYVAKKVVPIRDPGGEMGWSFVA